MPLIEAFLALALSLLALSMAATLIVDFIHRVLATRATNLKEMLEEYYDSEVKPVVKAELSSATGKALETREKFVEKLITNSIAERSPFLQDKLKQLVSLPTEEFLKKLANTNIGKVIKKKSEAEINEKVDSLTLMYQQFGSAASDAFKRQAQLGSFAAGIVVAFVLNANAVLMLGGYMDDPVVRDRVLAQAQVLEERFQQMPKGGADDGFENIDEVKALQGEIERNIATLENAGLAVGYGKALAPAIYWVSGNETEEPGVSGKQADGTGSGKGAAEPKTDSSGFGAILWKVVRTLVWFIGVFGTGLLIGLGGPFWYNVVKKLTAFLELVRGGPGGVAPATATVTGEAAAAGAAGTAVGSAVVVVDPMEPYRHLFKATGGVPESVRARVNMAAAKEANSALAVAAEAVKKAKEVAQIDPEQSAAVEAAEQSFSMAGKMVESLSNRKPMKDE